MTPDRKPPICFGGEKCNYYNYFQGELRADIKRMREEMGTFKAEFKEDLRAHREEVRRDLSGFRGEADRESRQGDHALKGEIQDIRKTCETRGVVMAKQEADMVHLQQDTTDILGKLEAIEDKIPEASMTHVRLTTAWQVILGVVAALTILSAAWNFVRDLEVTHIKTKIIEELRPNGTDATNESSK